MTLCAFRGRDNSSSCGPVSGHLSLTCQKKKVFFFGLASDRFEPTEAETDIGSVGEAATEVQVHCSALF
jgi:hypothetical protein